MDSVITLLVKVTLLEKWMGVARGGSGGEEGKQEEGWEREL